MRHLKMQCLLLFLALTLSSSLSAQGFQIYLAKAVPDLLGATECRYCFELTSDILFDSPFLEQTDIESFDWDTQTIKLTTGGRDKVEVLGIPLHGQAAAIVLDGTPIYGFWLWNEASSFGCDRVYAYPTLDFRLKFGLPNGKGKGQDPRYNDRLKEGLMRGRLMK